MIRIYNEWDESKCKNLHSFCVYLKNNQMSLRLEIKKLMLERSPRVKAIDFHPHNPWVVFALYSGTLALHDYSNNVLVLIKADLHKNPGSVNFSDPSNKIHPPKELDRMRLR